MTPDPPQTAELPFPERIIKNYVSGLREGHRFALDSQEQTDKMLTWAIGLMGAGILGSAEFFKPFPPTARFVAIMPWVFGILCAVAGRLVAREHPSAPPNNHPPRYNRFTSGSASNRWPGPAKRFLPSSST